MNAKRRPSVIVMKRLDTQGMRVLSQSAGEGTRRAGVRLSPKGGLLVHRRGEPITSAPPPNETPNAIVDRSPAIAPPMRAPMTFIPSDVRAFAKAALEEQIRESRADDRATSRGATSQAPTAASLLPALRLVPAPRRSLFTWGIVLVTLGILSGVTIARVVGSARVAAAGQGGSDTLDPPAVVQIAAGRGASPASASAPIVSNATEAPVVAPNASSAPTSLPIAVAAPAPTHRHHHAPKPTQVITDEAKSADPKGEANVESEDAAATSALVREQLGNSL